MSQDITNQQQHQQQQQQQQQHQQQFHAQQSFIPASTSLSQQQQPQQPSAYSNSVVSSCSNLTSSNTDSAGSCAPPVTYNNNNNNTSYSAFQNVTSINNGYMQAAAAVANFQSVSSSLTNDAKLAQSQPLPPPPPQQQQNILSLNNEQTQLHSRVVLNSFPAMQQQQQQQQQTNSPHASTVNVAVAANVVTVNTSTHSTASTTTAASVRIAESTPQLVTALSVESGDETEEENEIVEDSPDGRWSKRNQLVTQRDVPGIDKAYLAMDTENGFEVVWNEISLTGGKKFKKQLLHNDEIKQIDEIFMNLIRLTHPNIVKFHHYWIDDKFEDKKRIIFITEYMSSGSLKQFLRKAKKTNQSIKRQTWKRWCIQLLSALHYLHSSEPAIIHDDLSCDTIYIQHNGLIKIGSIAPDIVNTHVKTCVSNKFSKYMHFIAPESKDSTSASAITAASNAAAAAAAAVGSSDTRTASPLINRNYKTTAVDIYAFGMVALEMFNLEFGGNGDTHPVTAELIRQSIETLDEKQQDFIYRCLETDPSKRPTAKQLLFHPLLFEVPSLRLLSAHQFIRNQNELRETNPERLFNAFSRASDCVICTTTPPPPPQVATSAATPAATTTTTSSEDVKPPISSSGGKVFKFSQLAIFDANKYLEDVRNGIYPLTAFGLENRANTSGAAQKKLSVDMSSISEVGVDRIDGRLLPLSTNAKSSSTVVSSENAISTTAAAAAAANLNNSMSSSSNSNSCGSSHSYSLTGGGGGGNGVIVDLHTLANLSDLIGGLQNGNGGAHLEKSNRQSSSSTGSSIGACAGGAGSGGGLINMSSSASSSSTSPYQTITQQQQQQQQPQTHLAQMTQLYAQQTLSNVQQQQQQQQQQYEFLKNDDLSVNELENSIQSELQFGAIGVNSNQPSSASSSATATPTASNQLPNNYQQHFQQLQLQQLQQIQHLQQLQQQTQLSNHQQQQQQQQQLYSSHNGSMSGKAFVSSSSSSSASTSPPPGLQQPPQQLHHQHHHQQQQQQQPNANYTMMSQTAQHQNSIQLNNNSRIESPIGLSSNGAILNSLMNNSNNEALKQQQQQQQQQQLHSSFQSSTSKEFADRVEKRHAQKMDGNIIIDKNLNHYILKLEITFDDKKARRIQSQINRTETVFKIADELIAHGLVNELDKKSLIEKLSSVIEQAEQMDSRRSPNATIM